MPDYFRGWVKLLERDVAHFKALVRESPRPADRRVFLLYARRLERAIEMYTLGTIFEVAALRARNFETERGRRR